MKLVIPVQRYVKKFLVAEYGPEPIAVRANSDLGRVMILPFAKGIHVAPDFFDLQAEGITPEELDETKENVTFSVGFAFDRAGIVPDRILLLSLALNGLFRQSLFYFCKGRRTLYNSETSAVKIFLSLYGLSEDVLPEATAVKMAQRERWERSKIAG